MPKQNQRQLRVISWNILHDNRAKNNHAFQADRLADIAKTISKYTLGTPTVIFLCEGVSQDSITKLASMLGKKFKLHGTVAYPNDWMCFLSNQNGAKYEDITHKEMKIKWPKTKSAALKVNSLQLNGLHIPEKPLGEIKARFSILKTVLASINKKEPSVIVGDFNSLFFQPARIYIRLKGYKISKRGLFNIFADSFPSPVFRGKNIPKYTPKLPIDAHYYKGLKQTGRQSHNTNLSDHPIVISDFVLR